MHRNLPAVTRDTQRQPSTSRGTNRSIFLKLARRVVPFTPAGDAALTAGAPLWRRSAFSSVLAYIVSPVVVAAGRKGREGKGGLERKEGESDLSVRRLFSTSDSARLAASRAAGEPQPVDYSRSLSAVHVRRSSQRVSHPASLPSPIPSPKIPPRSGADGGSGAEAGAHSCKPGENVSIWTVPHCNSDSCVPQGDG